MFYDCRIVFSGNSNFDQHQPLVAASSNISFFELAFQILCFEMQGMNRHYKAILEELLTLFPCVAVVGGRQCGKTTILQGLPPEWQLFDMEKGSGF